MWFYENKRKIFVLLLIFVVLAAAFYFGGNAPDSVGWNAGDTESSVGTMSEEHPTQQSSSMEINPDTGKDQYLTDPVPEGKPLPMEPQDVTIGSTAYSCTISISCASIIGATTRTIGSFGKTIVPSGTASMSPVKRKVFRRSKKASSNVWSERR